MSCTKTKLEQPAPPAELYAPSPLFGKAREYCEQNHDDWFVLSAKHHLLEPDEPPIEPYDEALTGARVATKRGWSETVIEQLQSAGLLEVGRTLIFHAGRAYCEELLPLPEDIQSKLRIR